MANNKKSKRNKRKRVKSAYNPPYSNDILSTPLEKLKLQENTYQLLKNAGYTSLKEILSGEEKDFYKIIRFNKKNLADLKSSLIPFKAELKPSGEQVADNSKKPEGKKATIDAAAKETPAQDKFVKISKGGKWGFADRQGKEVIKAVYDNVFYFNEELCCVEKDELFGYIDREGNEVIPIQYDCACSFSEGLACVFKRDLCGYIDKQNNVVIEFKFEAGTPFEEGAARVKKDGKWAELKLKSSPADKGINSYTLRWIN